MFLSTLAAHLFGTAYREVAAPQPVPVQRAHVTWVPGYNGYAVVPVPTYTPESIRAAELAGEDMQDATNGAYSHLFIEPVDWWF